MFNGKLFEMYWPASTGEYKKIITKSPNKSCDLEWIHFSVVFWKKCIYQFLPLITGIINRSVTESGIQSFFKWATITHLLKRSGLAKEDIKNVYPISNLPFISKVIEKVVAKCIVQHNDLNDSYQSAYCRGQSTETALLKVHRLIDDLWQFLCTW